MADIMSAFAQSSNNGDEEMLRIASEYSLQVGPRQMRTLLLLDLAAYQYKHLNADLPILFGDLIAKKWLQLKHHHESGPFIMRVIDSLAVKKLVPNDAVKVNVMKNT